MPTGGQYRQLVAIVPKPKQAALRDITEVAVMSKLFTSEGIAQVDLNEWNRYREERIPQRNARVRERAGIKDDECDALRGRTLHAVDQIVFGVTLETGQLMPESGSYARTARLDIPERGRAVNVRLTRAEQVQIRTVDKEKVGHLQPIAASLPKLAAILTFFEHIRASIAAGR